MAFGGGTVKYIVGGQEVGNVYYSTNPIIFDEITNLGYDPTTAKSITYTTASGNTGTVTSSMTVYNITDYDGADSTVSIVYDEPTPANPTISQLHIDGVTYDLRDRNAGQGVTTEEKAKLAALPEAAEIPSDIGPKSEVVEEVPSEYVAGKVYFIAE